MPSENVRAQSISAKIIGGSKANINDWPWITALVFRSDILVFCGGSLIAKNWVLTAAHCVYNKTGTELDVIINPPLLQSGSGERIAIKQIIVHPLFNRITLQNDIALLKLASPSAAEPLETLPDYSNQDEAGMSATALGWGNTSTYRQIFPDNLQQVMMPIVSNAVCKEHMTGIYDTMLCAGFAEGGKDTCEGDSGGPLVVYDAESRSLRQAGITSFGESECAASGKFGVYTRLKSFKSFISDTICTPEQTPLAPSLKLTVSNTLATATWSSAEKATGYRLNYAPFPQGTPIHSIELAQSTQFTANLPKGEAFYVGITAYNGNCRSAFSNIEHFNIL
ncbi:MAG: serine protease [Methylococcales bacterium]|nr:serine protease [Methylococcales bacterium]